MADAVLVLNAGSSSLKLSVFLDGDRPELQFHGQIEGLSTRPRFVALEASGAAMGKREWEETARMEHEAAVEFLLAWGRGGPLGAHRIAAAGHRVVHGGTRFVRPARVDSETMEALEALIPLAPLHQKTPPPSEREWVATRTGSGWRSMRKPTPSGVRGSVAPRAVCPRGSSRPEKS